MPVSIAYGRRDGRLVHVHDLEAAQHRGMKCACVCPECGRPLEAHLGEQKSWHFQHHVEDASCNPQPMTLLHAFVRDELARRSTLVVPPVKVLSELHVNGRPVTEFVHVPAEEFSFVGAQAEARAEGVQPDVLYEVENGTKFAVEVRYTHAVDEEKLERMRVNFHKAAEFDVSDLAPSGITLAQLDAVLAQSHRWTWLINGNVLHLQSKARLRLDWMEAEWHPRGPFERRPRVRPATQRLRDVKTRLAWAQAELANLKKLGFSGDYASGWLGRQHKTDRVAIACAALRLDPEQLPPFLQQVLPRSKPQSALAHHPYSWQVVVFMKFCIGRHEFTPRECAHWCLRVLPDRCEHEDGTLSANGFTRTAAALHLYFLQLQAQGLLQPAPPSPEGPLVFTPRFETVSQLHEHLAGTVN